MARWCLGVLLLCGLPCVASAGTIYLCRSYGDGWFWSSAHCHHHQALVDRTVTVPDSLPWEQKVQLGEQARAKAAALAVPPRQPSVQQPQPAQRAQCASLARRVVQLDDMARRPQTAPEQDRIRSERKTVTDQQFRLGC